MKQVMLYFGSFNPVHNGHIAVAEYVLSQGLADELWFVVSPQNPLKEAGTLISERDRLEMVKLAISGSPYAERMRPCDTEFSLPRPSYTVDTLAALEKQYPDFRFSVLVGGDVPERFTQWKEWEKLLRDHRFYVYPRRGYGFGRMPDELRGKFTPLEGAPLFDVSSTEVRRAVAEGEGAEAKVLLPPAVYKYIKEKELWNKK